MSQRNSLSLCILLAAGLFTGLAGWSTSNPSGWISNRSVERFSDTSRPDQRRLLDLLKVGQSVALKDVDGGFELLLIDGTPLPQKVRAIGSDYLTIQDAGEVTELTIPIYRLHCIRCVKGLAGKE